MTTAKGDNDRFKHRQNGLKDTLKNNSLAYGTRMYG